jgi:hypothetical protein
VHLQWHYRIRLKAGSWVYHRGKGWQQFSQLHLQSGEAQTGSLWLIVSSETTTLQTLREYGLRCDIEESFLDDKSNGFGWEASGLRCALALSRLCLVMAVATLYLSLQGTAVVVAQCRRWVDTHWFRGMGYLKIGWHWVKAAPSHGWDLFDCFGLTSNRDPDPPKASRTEGEFLCYRLESTVLTIDCDP